MLPHRYVWQLALHGRFFLSFHYQVRVQVHGRASFLETVAIPRERASHTYLACALEQDGTYMYDMRASFDALSFVAGSDKGREGSEEFVGFLY